MYLMNSSGVAYLALALAGILMTLYIMRRRVRLGRRTPKF
jgi:hypothetical protein